MDIRLIQASNSHISNSINNPINHSGSKPVFHSVVKNTIKVTALIMTMTGLVSCSSSDAAAVVKDIFSSSISGTVTGLQGTLRLRNNNTDEITISSSGSFSFNNRLLTGASYNVTVQAQPAGQYCGVENSSGTIAGSNITDVEIVCVKGMSLSGSYQAAPLIQVDSDVNDPFAQANVNNDDFPVAQLIPNFSTVHGFSTFVETNGGTQGDRFANVVDEFGVYRVNLQMNQTLRLQVVDFSGNDVFQGDLDLALFDSGFNLIAISEETTEFENITVPTDGDYYIVVFAFSGTSKYTLSLNSVSPANVSYQNSVKQKSMNFIVGESIVKFKPSTKVSAFKASNQQMSLSHSHTTRATLANIDLEARAISSRQTSRLSSVNATGDFMENLKQNNFVSYQKLKTLQEIKSLNLRADVEYAEPNYIYQAMRVPNDQYYNLQWHYPAINLPQAWDITTGDRLGGGDVIVAVVDTGVFLAHPEFSGQLVAGYDFISNIENAADGDGIDNNPDDPGDSAQLSSSSWHGTHVAGTVAAESNNTSGTAGVAWSAKIMPLRVLGTQGGSAYDIMQAVLFAAGLPNDSNTVPAQKADIINLSLGGTGSSDASQDAYTAARAAGVIVVAAAGNENTSQLSYPASYDGVVSVSATDFINNRAPYSNFGAQVDVAAPGGSQGADLNGDGFGDGIFSTLVDDSSGSRVGTFNFYQGTSMAAPHVAGVFALMRAVHPTISPAEIDGALASGALTIDIGDPGRDNFYGFGLIDAFKSVLEAQRIAGGGVLPPAIIATPTPLALGQTESRTLTLSNVGGPIPALDSPIIVTVNDDAGWLTVTKAAGNVDPDSLGDYLIEIDRAGLGDAFYLGTITFSLSTGSSLQVQVSMTKGDIDAQGNPGTLYLLLIDSNNDVLDQVTATDVMGNGVYNYNFPSVPAGSYQIVGGSDIDNDVFICQLAEVCGGYPTINSLTNIEVIDSDITGLDFIVDILATFSAGSLSVDATNGSTGIRRLPVPMADVALSEKQLGGKQ